jgi:hypothetical protein
MRREKVKKTHTYEHHQALIQLRFKHWVISCEEEREERKWPGNCQERWPLTEKSPLKEGKGSLDLGTGIILNASILEDGA